MFVEEVVQSDAAWAELSGVEYDEVFGVSIPFKTQVVARGDVNPTASEVKPIDFLRKQVTTADHAAAVACLRNMESGV